jgi:hypothetical protein
VTTFFRVRHVLADREEDPRIGRTVCGELVAFGAPCPTDKDHFVIFPTCPNHGPVTLCDSCFQPKG